MAAGKQFGMRVRAVGEGCKYTGSSLDNHLIG